MAGKLGFLIFVVCFLGLLMWMSVDYAKTQQSMFSGSANYTGQYGAGTVNTSYNYDSWNAPLCNGTGIPVIGLALDPVVCAGEYAGAFLALGSVSSDFMLLNIVIFIPICFGIIYIVATLLRGGGD